MVLAFREFVERCGDCSVLAVSRTRQACVLIGPRTRRPQIFVSTEGLKTRLQVLVTASVLSMDPLLMGVKRIVALTTGIEGETRREARGRIIGAVVVAEIIV